MTDDDKVSLDKEDSEFKRRLSPSDTTPNGLLTPDAPVKIPLATWVKQLAEIAADRAAEKILRRHVMQCQERMLERVASAKKLAAENREAIVKVKISLAWMIGMMVGSGVVSGALVKLLG